MTGKSIATILWIWPTLVKYGVAVKIDPLQIHISNKYAKKAGE